MPQEPTYRTKVYQALKGELGDSFAKTEDEFNYALDNDKGYQQKVYNALKGELGNQFTKSEQEFYDLIKKKDGASSGSSGEQSPFLSIDQSLLERDSILPVSEPSTTRVAPQPMEKDVYQTSSIARKYGILPSKKEFKPEAIMPTSEGQKMLQDWTAKKYRDNPALQQMVNQTNSNSSILKETGYATRMGIYDQDPNLYDKIASNRIGELFLTALRAPNDYMVDLLRTLDGAERAFYDAISAGNLDEGGLFRRTADYMQESLEKNWPEADKNTVTGKLTYDFFHMVPFFGEMMITPRIGPFSELDVLLTTKGFAQAYGDADYWKELGYDRMPVVEGLMGGAMGLKDARAYHLLGYGASEAGKIASKLSKYGDIGVAHSMLAGALGFGSYDLIDQYMTEGGFVDPERTRQAAMLGFTLSSPGGLQMLGNRAMDRFYGMSSLNTGMIYELPYSSVELHKMASDFRERASMETKKKNQDKLLLAADYFDAAGEMKAVQVAVIRAPEDMKSNIEARKDLSPEQKEKMKQSVDDLVFLEQTKDLGRAEDILKGGEKTEEASTPATEGDIAPNEGEAPQKTESPIETLKTPSEGTLKSGEKIDITPEEHGASEVRLVARDKDGNRLGWVDIDRLESGEYFVAWEETVKDRQGEGVMTALRDRIDETGLKVTDLEQTAEGKAFAEGTGRPVVESLAESAKVLGGGKEPPKPPSGEVAVYEEGGKKPGEKTTFDEWSDRVDAREKAEKEMSKTNRASVVRSLREQFVDIKEPFATALLKEGGAEAARFLNRINTEAGASSYARLRAEEAQRRVFGKGFSTMPYGVQKLASEYADLLRSIEVDELMNKRREELVQQRIAEELKKAKKKLTGEEEQKLYENVRAQVEGEFKPMKHEGFMDAKKAKEMLELFRNKDPKVLAKYGLKDVDIDRVETAVKEYHKVFQENLRRQLEEGIITPELYDKLLEEQPHYSPRRYIEYMNTLDPDGSITGIKPLKGGSYGEKIVDMNTLMTDAIVRTEALVGRNRKLKAGADYARVFPQSDIIKNAPYSSDFKKKLDAKKAREAEAASQQPGIIPPKEPYMEPIFAKTPRGYIDVDYMNNGKRERLWIKDDMYQYFDHEPPLARDKWAMNLLSLSLGTPIIKFFATGANPEFAVRNLPIDAMHAWLTTDHWSSFMPHAMAQILEDYSEVWKDAVNKTGAYKEAMEEGIGMEYLTTQGLGSSRKFGKYTPTTSGWKNTRDAMGYIGETSEILTRLAIRNRYIKNVLKQWQESGKIETLPAKADWENAFKNDIDLAREFKEVRRDATAAARHYLDFSQGGSFVKLADKFIPYMNAGVQVTRGSLRAAYKNPTQYFTKVSQLALMTYGLTQWNTGGDKDDEESLGRQRAYMNDISPGVKARNFIIMTNIKYKDNNNNVKYLYFKFPKDALQSSITAIVEDTYVNRHVDPSYKIFSDKAKVALQNEFRNVPDVSSAPPALKMLLGWTMNLDLFYDTKIWTGKEPLPKRGKEGEYYEGRTPERYIWFGEKTGVSPVRLNYAMKQLFTESNPFVSAIGETMDGLTSGFGQNWDNVESRDFWENFSRSPFVRRVLKSTYPRPEQEMIDEEAKVNRYRLYNDHRLNKLLMDKDDLSQVDNEEFNSLINDIFEEYGPNETERIMNNAMYKFQTADISREVMMLKHVVSTPAARAYGMFSLIKKNPEKENEYMLEAEQAGIAGDDFLYMLGKLIDEDRANAENIEK